MRLGEKKVSGAYGNITERKGISLSLVWGLHWIFFFFLHDDGGFGNGDKPVEPRQWWWGGKPGDKPGSDLLSPTCHYRKWWSWLWWGWPLLCFIWIIPFSNTILLSSNFPTFSNSGSIWDLGPCLKEVAFWLWQIIFVTILIFWSPGNGAEWKWGK